MELGKQKRKKKPTLTNSCYFAVAIVTNALEAADGVVAN